MAYTRTTCIWIPKGSHILTSDYGNWIINTWPHTQRTQQHTHALHMQHWKWCQPSINPFWHTSMPVTLLPWQQFLQDNNATAMLTQYDTTVQTLIVRCGAEKWSEFSIPTPPFLFICPDFTLPVLFVCSCNAFREFGIQEKSWRRGEKSVPQ